jgi:hypothetical protein
MAAMLPYKPESAEEFFTGYYDRVESQFKQGLESLKLSVSTIKDKQAGKVLGPTKLKQALESIRSQMLRFSGKDKLAEWIDFGFPIVEFSSLLQQFVGDTTSKGAQLAKLRERALGGGKVTLDQLIEFCDTGAEVGKGQAKLLFEFIEGTGNVSRSSKSQEVDEAIKLCSEGATLAGLWATGKATSSVTWKKRSAVGDAPAVEVAVQTEMSKEEATALFQEKQLIRAKFDLKSAGVFLRGHHREVQEKWVHHCCGGQSNLALINCFSWNSIVPRKTVDQG